MPFRNVSDALYEQKRILSGLEVEILVDIGFNRPANLRMFLLQVLPIKNA